MAHMADWAGENNYKKKYNQNKQTKYIKKIKQKENIEGFWTES